MDEKGGGNGPKPVRDTVRNMGPKAKATPPAPDLDSGGGPADSGTFRAMKPKTGPDDDAIGSMVVGSRQPKPDPDAAGGKKKPLDLWKVEQAMALPNAGGNCDDRQKDLQSTHLGEFLGMRGILNRELDGLAGRRFSEEDETEREEWAKRASMFWYVHETSLRIFGALVKVDKQVAFMFFEDLHSHVKILLSDDFFHKGTQRIEEEYKRLEPIMKACVLLITMEAGEARITSPPTAEEILPPERIAEKYEDRVWARFTAYEIKRTSTPAPEEPEKGPAPEGGGEAD